MVCLYGHGIEYPRPESRRPTIGGLICIGIVNKDHNNNQLGI